MPFVPYDDKKEGVDGLVNWLRNTYYEYDFRVRVKEFIKKTSDNSQQLANDLREARELLQQYGCNRYDIGEESLKVFEEIKKSDDLKNENKRKDEHPEYNQLSTKTGGAK